MNTYVLLANWTDQGMRTIGDSPKRLDAVKKMLTDMGGAVKSFLMTVGQYDIIMIYEAPDDAVATRFTLKVRHHGNIRGETLKAFPENAYREILSSHGSSLSPCGRGPG
jgi:uncharacterized protein with GYD domain